MKEKPCGKCKKIKNVEEFNYRNRSKGTRNSYCRPCWRLYIAAHARKNRSAYVARNARQVARIRDYLNAVKDVPCADCGNKYHPCAMDLDHIRGEKSYTVSEVVTKGLSLENIAKEVAKCEVVCAVCHRIRTYNRIKR